MAKVSIVGVGPGMAGYITERARGLIRRADFLIGTKEHLGLFADKKKERALLEKNYSDIVELILKRKDRRSIVVMVSGDPGIFSFAKMIIDRLPLHEYEVVPGISMVQLLCARIGHNWDDIEIISLHGRSRLGLIDAVRNNRNVFIYTDCKNTPQQVAQYLVKSGIRKRTVYVGENLSRTDERITKTTIAKLKDMIKKWKRLCVIFIKK